MQRVRLAPRAVLISVGAVFTACALRECLRAIVGDIAPFMMFCPAIVVATLYGGRGGGLLALGLAGVFALVDFPDVWHLRSSLGWNEGIVTAAFVVVNLFLIWLTDSLAETRRKAQVALAARDTVASQISQLLNTITDSFATFDLNWHYVYVNDSALKAYGTTREEFMGRSLWEHFPHLVGTEFERRARRAMATGEADRFEFFSQRWQRWFDYRLYPSVDGLTLYATDIHERKCAAEELRASEERFRTMADNAPVMIWLSGIDKAAYWFNRGWLEFTGRTIDEELESGWLESVHPADRSQCLATYTTAFDARRPFTMDYRLRRHDGEYRWVLDRGVPLLTSEKSFQGYIGSCIDIGERKSIEQQRELLLESERAARGELEKTNRLKDEFLATLSHELRTPLNAILGWASFIRMSKMSETEVSEAVATIERNARLQAQLIEDLLEMNAIVSGKIRLDIQDLDLPLVIESALETVRHAAEAKQIRVQKTIDSHAGPVRGDPARLQQVVWNLLSNAIKFTPAGGDVQVALRAVKAEHVEIEISDTGQGINAEFLPHVFERFRQADASSTRKVGGLGLGLSIVRHLVELHGGTVDAHSAGEGQGATFTVQLPVAWHHADTARREIPSRRASATVPVELHGVRVMVVDDEPDACRLVKRLLEERSAVVETATSASEAFDRMAISQPDVLISDIGMPEQDGYELIRRVRANSHALLANVPAVALTAFARADDRRRSHQAGYQVHLSKPVDSGELVAVVADLAGRGKP